MKTIKVKITDIKANPNNPRLIKDDKFAKLVKSVQEFPEMLEIRPIVVNSDMVVLGGNMRLKACKEAGIKEVPIIIADNLTEEQQREFLIKDNESGISTPQSINCSESHSLASRFQSHSPPEWDSEQLIDWGVDIPDFSIEEELEQKDLSSEIDNLFRIEIICKDEESQENTYNKLIEQGYECRLLTL